MFEADVWGSEMDVCDWDLPEVDLDAVLARDPLAGDYIDPPFDIEAMDSAWPELLDEPPGRPERIFFEEDRPRRERHPESFSDAEALTRLVEVEAGIARSHAFGPGWSP